MQNVVKYLPTVVTIGLSVSLGVAEAVQAADFSFTRIVDTATAIPDGVGSFTDFGYFDLDNGKVAFVGLGGDGQQGIYTSVGGTLQRVLDSTTIIPGTSTPFGNSIVISDSLPPTSTFDGLSLSDDNLAFSYRRGTGQPGVFAQIGDSLNVIASTNTPIPGGQGNFVNFSTPDISGDRIVFAGASADSEQGLESVSRTFPAGSFNGVYSSDGGTLDVVANRSTPAPGGGNFVFFGDPQVDGNNIAFVSFLGTSEFTAPQYVYGSFDGSLRRLGSNGQPLNATISLSGENVVWSRRAFSPSSERRIEAFINGELTTVARSGVGQPFSYVFDSSIDGQDVAFEVGIDNVGGTPNFTGIYATLGGDQTKVIESRDLLDGKSIAGMGAGLLQTPSFQAPILRDGRILFTAQFADGSRGLYLAQALTEPIPVPESSPVLGIFTLGVLGVMSRTIKK